jgi:hypothetical protein
MMRFAGGAECPKIFQVFVQRYARREFTRAGLLNSFERDFLPFPQSKIHHVLMACAFA